MSGPDLILRARLLCGAHLARRARTRKDKAAYLRHILHVLDLALADAREKQPAAAKLLNEAILNIEPVGHTHGGFFSCLFESGSGVRYFLKCVNTDSREVIFWNAWRRGLIRTEGRHYRIIPPVLMLGNRDLAFLVFPEIKALAAKRATRGTVYRKNINLVVRAIAEFNADHLGFTDPDLPVSSTCNGLRVPRRATIIKAFSDADTGDILEKLRRIERRWPAVRERVYDAPLSLSQLDFGPGNFLPLDGAGLIQDFGRAALAPVGSDLHTVFRYSRPQISKNRLIELYTEVFAAKGIATDTDRIRLALDAHFSTRYRNLNTLCFRSKPAFDSALVTSLALIKDRPKGLGIDGLE